jgi:predicted amidophosphoribosyltransferase
MIWLGVIGAFIGPGSAFSRRALAAHRHQAAACPSCGAAPIIGPYWVCDLCNGRFDTFEHRAMCPRCAKNFSQTKCQECHQSHPMADWFHARALSEP